MKGLEILTNTKILPPVLPSCSFCLKIYVWYSGLVVKEGWLGFYVYVDISKYRRYNTKQYRFTSAEIFLSYYFLASYRFQVYVCDPIPMFENTLFMRVKSGAATPIVIRTWLLQAGLKKDNPRQLLIVTVKRTWRSYSPLKIQTTNHFRYIFFSCGKYFFEIYI